MRRSGKLLAVLLCAAALTACTTAVPDATPAPAEAACPPGLADALEEFLLTRPLGDRMPVEAIVTENSETMPFPSDLVASLVGCTMTLESVYSGGDRMVQMFGLADGLDEAEVIAAFEAAGWVQIVPYAWGTEDQSESAGVFTLDSEQAAFGFDRWSEFIGPDDVVLTGAPGI